MASEFSQRVYELCCKIPIGKVTTYWEIAHTLNTKAYQAVGQALRCNADPITIPCFKVVKSDGSLGGYGGNNSGGIEKKKQKLLAEGIEVIDGKIDVEKYLFRFGQIEVIQTIFK